VDPEAPWSVGMPDQTQVSHDEFGWSPVSSLTAPAPRWWGNFRGGEANGHAVDPGPDVVALLQRDPQAELQVLLEVLEPITTIEQH